MGGTISAETLEDDAETLLSQETLRASRKLAAMQGVSLDKAIRDAVEERISEILAAQEDAARILAAAAAIRTSFRTDPVTKREYDDACGDDVG